MIEPSSIFQFSSEDVEKLIIKDKELNLAAKFIQAFEYVLPRLAPASPDPFSEDQEVECGRYMWSRYLIEDVDILIRRYRGHITLYARSKKDTLGIGEVPIYSAYTFDLKSIISDDSHELMQIVVDIMDAIKQHDLRGMTGLSQTRCDEIWTRYRAVTEELAKYHHEDQDDIDTQMPLNLSS